MEVDTLETSPDRPAVWISTAAAAKYADRPKRTVQYWISRSWVEHRLTARGYQVLVESLDRLLANPQGRIRRPKSPARK